MASRMEKYHSNASSTGRRSIRNESLYKDIYDNVEYSNIEKVATIEKTNEISLEQIKDLLREREQKKVEVPVKKIIPKAKPVEERNYDIRDVLVKAKDDHVDDNKNRNLKNTQYNILKNINLRDSLSSSEQAELEKTLVNTSVLKNIDDNELSLDMLSDLKSTGDTVVENTNLLKEVQEAKDKYEVHEDDGLDKSFYTSSLNFKDEDFEQLKDLQDSIESNNKMIKILFFLLFMIIAGVIGYILFKFI